ncbi:MAG: glycosyltransferase [Treponema sp.]|nr:glycosyltransferase [Treponema sp.]
MKIAMFTDAYFPRINGVAVSVHSYADSLAKAGHDVCVVCLDYSEKQQKKTSFNIKLRDRKEKFRILRIPSQSASLISKEDRMARLTKWRFLRKKMDEFAPDIIHVNTEFTLGYFGVTYARHRHVPYIYTFHTLWDDYIANYIHIFPVSGLRKFAVKVIKFYLKRANLILAPTVKIENLVKEYGITKPVRIQPTGIPDSKLKFNLGKSKNVYFHLFKKFPQLLGKKALLFVGRVVKEKNLDFLFDVLLRVQQELPKTMLIIVGGGPYLEDLKKHAKEKGLEKSVCFTDYMDGNDLIYLYKIATVFTFPSKTETQGLVTIEAMLAGLPVVAIGEMGTLDVMQGDNGGFMVKDNVEEFSQKTIELIKNKKLHEQKAKDAVAWANKWKISSLTPQLVDSYNEAIRLFKEEQAQSE